MVLMSLSSEKFRSYRYGILLNVFDKLFPSMEISLLRKFFMKSIPQCRPINYFWRVSERKFTFRQKEFKGNLTDYRLKPLKLNLKGNRTRIPKLSLSSKNSLSRLNCAEQVQTVRLTELGRQLWLHSCKAGCLARAPPSNSRDHQYYVPFKFELQLRNTHKFIYENRTLGHLSTKRGSDFNDKYCLSKWNLRKLRHTGKPTQYSCRNLTLRTYLLNVNSLS